MMLFRILCKSLILIIVVLSMGVSNAYGQTLTSYAKKHKAELAEKQKAEKEAYESACIKGTIDDLRLFVKNYPKSRYVSEANLKIRNIEVEIEKDAYESVCKTGTIEAFRGYLEKYPKSQYSQDIQNRIKDFDLWSVAKVNNTIQAYNSYLQNSNYKTFEKEAKVAIEDLIAVSEWQNIKSSKNLSDIQSFIGKYPNSSIINDVINMSESRLGNKELSLFFRIEQY